MRTLCTCGRDEVELGCDLCRYCRADYEERQYHREQEAAFNALHAPGASHSQSVPRP